MVEIRGFRGKEDMKRAAIRALLTSHKWQIYVEVEDHGLKKQREGVPDDILELENSLTKVGNDQPRH